MLRTQLGNNNAYCHDSPLTWVDWTMAERNSELVEYVGSLIDFRKKNLDFCFLKPATIDGLMQSGKRNPWKNTSGPALASSQSTIT